jgi:RNA polymerase primary sigma factor
MASLPRPLIALLVATLAAFGLWYVELKPSSSSSGGSSQGLGAYQSAINKAHQAVKISGAANAKLGAPTSTGPAPNSPTTTNASSAKATATNVAAAKATTAKATPAVKTAAPAKPAARAKTVGRTNPGPAKPAAKTLSTAQQVSLIENAIDTHKVVAVLFYNTAASDDQAMAHELAAVPTHGGKVVKLAVPVSELTSFGMITQQVPVVTAPTLVLIDAARQATTITGFADPLEISQRVDDALAAK